MASTLEEELVKYLTDAYALESQAITQLEAAQKVIDDPDIQQTVNGHLMESQAHEQLVGERLEAHGESPSKLKAAAGKAGALGLGAAASASPDTPGKLIVTAYAFEHLEIASYELLRRVAERAGDTGTVEIAERILKQERDAAEKLSWHFDAAVDRSLEAQGVAG